MINLKTLPIFEADCETGKVKLHKGAAMMLINNPEKIHSSQITVELRRFKTDDDGKPIRVNGKPVIETIDSIDSLVQSVKISCKIE